MRPADPICMWCASADADLPARCDARLGPTSLAPPATPNIWPALAARLRRICRTASALHRHDSLRPLNQRLHSGARPGDVFSIKGHQLGSAQGSGKTH
jgi:hypothetical protein